MAAFSKINFIVPLNTGDKILKIRNITGKVVHIIREATATVKNTDKFINLKQSGEANKIVLDFLDVTEAIEASILLRDALNILASNQGVSISGNTGSGWNSNNGSSDNRIISFAGPNTTPGFNFNFNVNARITTIVALYVNGLLVDNNIISNYSYVPSTTLQTSITWLASSQYALDYTDVCTIYYK